MPFSNGPEFKRLDALPRRVLTLPSNDECRAISRELRLRPDDECAGAYVERTDGTLAGCNHCTLRNIQCAALLEALQFGLYAPMRPGAGKTLVTFLIPTVRGKQRPGLLVPASMRESTCLKKSEAMKHWRINQWLYVESYETVSRQENRLAELDLDCLILDESHKVKNKQAGVTRRVTKLVLSNPSLEVYAATGTAIRKSYINPGHVAQYCLGLNNPYPNDSRTLAAWAREVDPPKKPDDEVEATTLFRWTGRVGKVEVSHVRDALRRRIVETPGVVATSDAGPECGLNIDGWDCGIDPVIIDFIRRIDDYGQLPCGKDLVDHIRMHDAKAQGVLGYYIDWVEQPPAYWMHARRLFFRFVRHCCQHYGVDTVDHFARELGAGHIQDRNAGRFMEMLRIDPSELEVPTHVNICEHWRECKPTFTPRNRVNWISSQPLEAVAAWCDAHPHGLVWCRNPCFGETLEREFGIPYYGAGGYAKNGVFIEHHKRGSGAAIASISAQGVGKDLQHAWSENLLLQPSKGKTSAAELEQLLARTHRDGQPADDVWLYVNVTYPALVEAFHQTKLQAIFHEEIGGQPQRLCYANDLLTNDLRGRNA